jgi:uncharacterized protein
MSYDVAVVTGCSSGLGLEITRRLLEQGTSVVGVSRRQVPAFDGNDNFVHIAGDVGDSDTAVKAFEGAAQLGTPDLLIQCAGVGVFGPPGGYSRKDVDDVLAGNLIGTILFADYAFRLFTDSGAGTIVNVVSTAAHAARPTETIYTAAKWGARGYTEALRAAAKGSKVRVIAAYPGGMRTDFWTNSRGVEPDTSSFSDPGEVAEALLRSIEPHRTVYVTDVLLNRI